MSHDARITASIEGAVDRADLPLTGDLNDVTARGTRLRRRRRTTVLAGAVGSVAAVGLAVSLLTLPGPAGTAPAVPGPPPATASDPSSDPAPSERGWRAVSVAPLSPRYGSMMVWTGQEVLVLSGSDDVPCPPTARCVARRPGLRDGAAYDPVADTWRTIAAPPADLGSARAFVVDGLVVTGTSSGWLTYDPAANRWSEIDLPASVSSRPEAAADGIVYAHDRQRRISAYDVAAGSWSTIPTDPITPLLADTQLFATDAGLVLAGVSYAEATADEPILLQADVWDGEQWSRLPRTGMIGMLQHWTGERLVGLEPGGADGGQVNGWDRSYPAGGALDPSTGIWEPVPGLPDDYTDPMPGAGGWQIEAADGPLMASGGRVYDDRTRTWTDLARPDSALDVEMTAVWADGRLVSFGGFNSTGWDSGGGTDSLGNQTWVWTP